MNAYENELAAATAHIEKLKPGLLATMDRTAAAEQLKLYWNQALASDYLHGHNPDGIIARHGDGWSDHQLVLLSSLQRGLADGPWKLRAYPAESGSVLLYAKTDRIDAAVRATSTRKGMQLAWVSGTGQGAGLVEGLLAPHPVPMTGLLNAMFLGAALRASEFGALRAEWGCDTEGLTYNTWHTIRCLWGLGRAVADPDTLEEIAGAADLTVEHTQEVLDGIVKAAAAAGYRQSRASEKMQLANFVPKTRPRPAATEEVEEPSNPLVDIGSGSGVMSVSGERFKEMFADGIPTDPGEMAERFQAETERQGGYCPGPAVAYTDDDVAGVFPVAALTVPGFEALSANEKAIVGILGLELGGEAPGTYRLVKDWSTLVLSRDGSPDRDVVLTADGLAELSIRPDSTPAGSWLEAVGCGPVLSRGSGQLRTRPFTELLAEQESLIPLAQAFSESLLNDLPHGSLWCPPGLAMYEGDDGMFTAFRSGGVFVMEEDPHLRKQLTHIGGLPVTAILTSVYTRAAALGADPSRDHATAGLYHAIQEDLREAAALENDGLESR